MKAKVAVICALAIATVSVAQAEVTPEQMVDQLNRVFGQYVGVRASHAKGFCVSGQFVSSGGGAMLSSAPAFKKHQTTPLVGRFSLGGGNPNAPDNVKNLKGFSFAMEPKTGGEHDFVMISAPMFFAKNPDEFVAFLKARTPDWVSGQVDQAGLEAFNKEHPHTLLQSKYLASQPIPKSYGTIPYFAVSTFYLENAKGKKTAIRWRLEPVAGHKGISEEEALQLGQDFLEPEMIERLKSRPVKFKLFAILADQDDKLLDPTQVWPEDRKEVMFGTVEVKGMQNQSVCNARTFVPTILPMGVLPSEDPTLAVRSPAYAISFARRHADKMPVSKVWFKNLQDGAVVSNPVQIEFGVEGMRVVPAGEIQYGLGHHHLIIDGKPIPRTEFVPFDDTHKHFGKAQLSTALTLPPGEHTLTLQFADGAHRSYGPEMSQTIHITVKP